jgi:6-phosphogluconolactonase
MNTPVYAYVGSRTTRERNARGEGISVYRVDPVSGSLSRVQLLGGLVNPSFLTLSKKGDRLYAVHGDGTHASSFTVDRNSGQLSLLNQMDFAGQNPVHLALNADESSLLVSSHLTGEVLVIAVDDQGRIGTVTHRERLPGEPGPHRKEQPFSKPHFNPLDPSGRWVLVPDKGLDRLFVFSVHGGRLLPAATPWLQVREGAGPRNLVFHPSKPWAYLLNELDSTVLACRFNADTGALEPIQWLSTLPDTYTGNSRAATIAVDASGRTLYASNRGSDSIAVFNIDENTGRLSLAQVASTQGRTPRFFTLHPAGRWLYALNEDSDTIVTLVVDAGTGQLEAKGLVTACASPVCMVFSR